jgi:cell division topological specificity factor
MRRVMERLGRRKRKSASKAKERLQLVLIHDRTNLPPDKIEHLKDEIIEVISRHIEVDRKAVRIEMAQEGREHRLIADIPLITSIRPRRRR